MSVDAFCWLGLIAACDIMVYPAKVEEYCVHKAYFGAFMELLGGCHNVKLEKADGSDRLDWVNDGG